MAKSNKKRSSKKTKKDWYSVRVLLRCHSKDESRAKPLYEDRLILVSANSHTEAQRRAHKLAQKVEFPYTNVNGNRVIWKVSDVVESVELFDDEEWDGKQLYWRYFRSVNPNKHVEKTLMNKPR